MLWEGITCHIDPDRDEPFLPFEYGSPVLLLLLPNKPFPKTVWRGFFLFPSDRSAASVNGLSLPFGTLLASLCHVAAIGLQALALRHLASFQCHGQYFYTDCE
jgi:hypothetical protein